MLRWRTVPAGFDLFDRRTATTRRREIEWEPEQKDPEGGSAAGKFTVVQETARLNTTELSAYLPGAGPISGVSGALAAGIAGCK